MRRFVRQSATKAVGASPSSPSLLKAATGGLPLLHRQQVRSLGYTHAILRTPTKGTIPLKDLKGNNVDVEEVLEEFDHYVATIKQTVLFDDIQILVPWGTMESLAISDMLTHYQDVILPMPRWGQEHRNAELNDTLRFIRAHGAPGNFSAILQQHPDGRAHAGDFVPLPTGMLVAQSSRTNSLTIQALKENKVGEGEEKYAPFPVNTFDLEDDSAPPLGDFFGFAGRNTLVVWGASYGNRTIKYVTEMIKTRPWEIIKIEEGCNFLTFYGGHPKYDVVLDEDYGASIEAIGNAGFNVIPVKWRAMRSLGLSMRAVTLCIKFSRGGYGAGGFHNHDSKMKSEARVVTSAKKLTFFRGDQGTPLSAQWNSAEMVKPLYQEPPRYKAPMHFKGGIVPSEFGDDNDRTRPVPQKPVPRGAGPFNE